MIAGFITPTSGTLTLGGVDIQAPGAERGMVFQQGALFEWLTVARNVDFGLRMKGVGERRPESWSISGSILWVSRVLVRHQPINCLVACSSVLRLPGAL